ncbi:IS5 family transposase [Nonomuraea gerenzanensis]|uniref:IS5 family transposase n=1 Tax=Nonomuraea gerenzanensis TaxID=93944 RepID=UPI001CD97E45|nr:IS5 family transposase [Nonomuraea gerenzanensis]UBU18761.1 IS5 family transposase [Nonomuraea gerenzanensis]UBU18916.1 IS5 family transposase [Nonomuraea gerenzanensis]
MNASGCASPGCGCRGRKPAYPSDLTDAEWLVLEGEARGVMAELVAVAGRPMVHDLRAVLDGIGYVTRYGIEWRALPVDFPPHEAVYAFFLRWSRRGLPEQLAARLRGRLRVLAGRRELPTAGCVDSQTVRAAETIGAAACGYDAGKKLKGQKRHVVVDTLGLLLCVIVTAASVQDRDGAHPVLALLREKFSTIGLVWADGGYAGRLQVWARQVLGLAVTIVKRSDDLRGFVVLPRRWVVERTFAWLVRYRRLARIYERKPAHHEAMIWWATVHQMTRRLTRELAGLPSPSRWSGPPPLPVLSSPDRRGKVLQLLAAQPWRVWRGSELAAILKIENVNSFRVQLSQWSHQGYINKLGPALYGPTPAST